MTTVSDTPGFLSADEDSPFAAHAYIASMARSGSTLLCNIFSKAPTHWMVVEPWFMTGATTPRLADTALQFDVVDTATDWHVLSRQRTADRLRQRYRDMLAPGLSRLERWGAKEVRFDFHEPTISMIRPRHIVINTRDIREVYLSHREKAVRQGKDDEQSPEWAATYCLKNSAAMVGLMTKLGERLTTIARYEDFAHSQHERQRIADLIDWPLVGDEAGQLSQIDRGYEVQRHSNQKPVKLTAEMRGLSEDDVRIADEVAERCTDYQNAFGYR